MDWAVVSWIVAAAVLLAAAGHLWRAWRAAVRRRERQLHYLRAGHYSRPQRLAPAPAPTGMSPDQAATVQANAERSARQDWIADRRAEANPYSRGSPEYVLWSATYHLTLHELDEPPAPGADPRVSPR